MDQIYKCERNYSENDIPVIVTGASSDHFFESLGLLETINIELKKPFNYPKIKIVYYNLGLQDREIHLIERLCNCTVRDFPFDLFPWHVRNLSSFAWKPLIIRRMLYEEDFVMWVDSSIRFVPERNMTPVFINARQNGIQCMLGQGKIAQRTSYDTMVYLKQNPKQLLSVSEVQGGFGVYSRARHTIDNVVDIWVKCALSEDCIWSKASRSMPKDCINFTKDQEYSFCHRTDQSVLGIILTSLYQMERNNCTTFKLDNTAEMYYFPDDKYV